MVDGKGRNGLDGILAQLDAAQDLEQERLLAEMVELKLRLRLAEMKQAALRRSEMSAAAKSRYIRKHGVEAYNRLPMK
jgi:hypothetical protein